MQGIKTDSYINKDHPRLRRDLLLIAILIYNML